MLNDITKIDSVLDVITTNPADLILINWSGVQGFPGLPPELKNELVSMQKDVSDKLNTAKKDEFQAALTELTESMSHTLDAITMVGVAAEHPLRSCIQLIKDISDESLLLARDNWLTIAKKKDEWNQRINNQIDLVEREVTERSIERFRQIKTSFLSVLDKHPNMLIIWAMGNDGENIDVAPFWQEIFKDSTLIDHCVFVGGCDRIGRRDRDSNYTELYQSYSSAAPFKALAWNAYDARENIRDDVSGTSFSVPRVTVEAFKAAQRLLAETQTVPPFTDVKREVIGKTFR